jgi:hypothetical protein
MANPEQASAECQPFEMPIIHSIFVSTDERRISAGSHSDTMRATGS